MLNRTPLGADEDTTTPAAMAGNLRSLVLGDTLTPRSRHLLRDWMVNCKTGADRLRAGLPGHWVIGNKTGNNGKDAFGDIAVAWPTPDAPILICVYTRGGRPHADQVTNTFRDIGRLVATAIT